MSIVRMKKLQLLSSKEDKKQIFKLLHKLNCVEISVSEISKDMDHINDSEEADKNAVMLSRVEFALNIYKELITDISKIAKTEKKKFKGGKRAALAPTPTINFEEFYSLKNKENELISKLEVLEKLDTRLTEIKAEKAKNQNLIAQVLPYESVDVKLSAFRDTKNVAIGLGIIPVNKVEEIKKIEEDDKSALFYLFGTISSHTPIVYICPIENKEVLLTKLSTLEFTACNLHKKEEPKKLLENYKEEIKILDEERIQIVKEIMQSSEYMEEFRLYYDYYSLQKKLYDYETQTGSTKNTFLVEGWLPFNEVDAFTNEISKNNVTVYYEFLDPGDGEEPPILTKHNKFVTPFTSVTNLLAPPRYYEIDPTAFVSFFLFFMAGIMLSDFGYGLIISLASAYIIFKKKYKKGKGNLVKLMFWMGVSGMIWGVLFGTYFGFSSTNTDIAPGIIRKPLLFDVLEKPLPMLALGLGIGIVHIFTGICINAYVLVFKKHKILAGIVHFLAWFLLILGLAMMGAKAGYSLIVEGKTLDVPKAVSFAGKILALIGLVFVAVDGMLDKDGVLKKITGAISGLYGIINILADVLSYSRLFGLGLATAVVGFVFNSIGAVMIGLIPGVGWIIAILFFIVGHLFNVAIGALGAYVHGARLEFVEFFGKFYEGGGKLFEPYGSTIKYFELDNTSLYEDGTHLKSASKN